MSREKYLCGDAIEVVTEDGLVYVLFTEERLYNEVERTHMDTRTRKFVKKLKKALAKMEAA